MPNKKKNKTWNVPVSFSFLMTFDVEAATPEEAARKIEEDYYNNKLDGMITERLATIAQNPHDVTSAIELEEAWDDATEEIG